MPSEFRVRWRRTDWTKSTATKSRTFARRCDLDRFAAKLRSNDRPELAPVDLEQHEREVGAWRPLS